MKQLKSYFLASLLAGTFNLSAQEATTPSPESRPDRPGPRQRLNEVVRREEATRERLETLNPVRRGARNEGLSEEQQAKLRELNQKMRDEQRVLYDKQREARVALEKAAQAEDFKEAEIRAKAAVIGEIEAELALIRAKHYKELSQILPKEEMQRIREANAGARPGVGGQLPGGGRPGLNRPAVTPQQQQ